MALLDRVKERVETDLSDAELQRMIDEALQEIIDRWGPSADPALPITAQLDGDRRTLDLARPIDSNQPVVVTEHTSYWPPVGQETSVVLSANDYRVWHDGRTLQRLFTGDNPRYRWGQRVEVEYTPQNDGNQRQEVVVRLVQLAIRHGAKGGVLTSQTVGDVSQSWSAGQAGYAAERERLLASLAPRKGLFFR